MSLALQPVRIESGAVRIRRKPCRKAVFLCNRHQIKFGMPFQKITNAFFVFLRRKGTGGIKEHSACLQHRCASLQNLRLLTAAKRKHIRIPAFHHIRLLTEHSLAAARRIHQNLIKKMRQPLRNPLRCFAHHNRIAYPRKLHVFQKRLCSACADVIRNQKSRSAQSCAKLCGFSTRCGAKVKHPVSFPNRQRRRRAHSAWLLQII